MHKIDPFDILRVDHVLYTDNDVYNITAGQTLFVVEQNTTYRLRHHDDPYMYCENCPLDNFNTICNRIHSAHSKECGFYVVSGGPVTR